MDRPTLIQVFSPLLAKLTKLELYHDTIRYGEVPYEVDLINGIESEIFSYPPKEAIALIDQCLALIAPLKERGYEIVSNVSVDMYYDELGDYNSATEAKTSETKKELYESVSSELIFFEYKLINLKEVLTEIIISSELAEGKPYELHLSPKTKLPELKDTSRKIDALDIYQSALLFHYLKEVGLILPYHPNSLAKFASRLTGHSEQNLRTTSGFGFIEDIKSDKAGNKNEIKKHSHHNLTNVKLALSKIIKEIDSEIARQDIRKQKK